eukprot:135552_1
MLKCVVFVLGMYGIYGKKITMNVDGEGNIGDPMDGEKISIDPDDSGSGKKKQKQRTAAPEIVDSDETTKLGNLATEAWVQVFIEILPTISECESVQKAVFSLFGFSPIFVAIYIFQKTKQLSINHLSPDMPTTIQFFCIFGCIVYLLCYFTPKQMYLFITNDFIQLTFIQQLVSLFIAISFASFLIILAKNCNFLSINNKHKVLDMDENIHHDITELKTAHVMVVKKKRKRRKRKKKRID